MEMPRKYKLQSEVYITPRDEDLPLILKVRGAETFVKTFAHHLGKVVGYQDCTVAFQDQKKKRGTCIHCDSGVKSRARFTWDFFVKRGEEWKPGMIRMNPTSHNKLRETVAAMSLTGRKFEDTALALTIGTDKKYGYKFYEFRLHETEQPPPPTPPEPIKESAFTDIIPEEPEETDGVMTATDEMILAKNVGLIFDDSRTWTAEQMKAAFYVTLKEDYNIDDEKHATEVAAYVLANYDELKTKYT